MWTYLCGYSHHIREAETLYRSVRFRAGRKANMEYGIELKEGSKSLSERSILKD